MVRKAIAALLLLGPGCFAQNATVNVKADAGSPRDTRPFGKYLAEICTLSGEKRTVTCRQAPLAAPVRKPSQPGPGRGARAVSVAAAAPSGGPVDSIRQETDQNITISIVCDPAAKGTCVAAQSIVAGTDFFVQATADSGQKVSQKIITGSVTPVGGSGTVRYRANAPGMVIIRATADEVPSVFAAAAPVDLLLQVVANADSAGPACAVLPQTPASTSSLLDAPSIVSLLGNPTPFLLSAQGPNAIAVYATRQPPNDEERTILASFQESIALLAGRTFTSLGLTPPAGKPFTVELSIPHAGALGDLATKINTLNYSQFTVQDAGSRKIRVTAPSQPDCATWTGFLTDIRHMGWQLISSPMSAKLYYLSSSDVATAFSGLSSGSSATAAAGTPSAAPAATTPAAGAASAGGSTPSASATASSGSTGSTTISVTQPAGTNIQINSDTTPCVVAGLATGSSTACGAPATPAAAATAMAATASSTPAAAAPPGMASVAVAMAGGEQTPPDLLVFSDTNPGDDAQIAERQRILAQLDLPRPEMVISAWVTQNSTTSKDSMGAFTNLVKQLVANYDQEFTQVVLKGWKSLKDQQAADRQWFNEPFRSYIADRFVADTFQAVKPGAGAQELSQDFLDHSQARLADPAGERRTDLGICERGKYCLGYSDLFDAVKPRLTDLLLNLIAAENPVAATDQAIAEVEGHPSSRENEPLALSNDEAGKDTSEKTLCDGLTGEFKDRCRDIWDRLDIDHVSPERPASRSLNCTDRDYRGILYALFKGSAHDPLVHLQCFKDAMDHMLTPESAGSHPPFGAGLIRAALADFLFNYKMSQQYPHEFDAYYLKSSADALNTALNPVIDAFNRDLWTYQTFVRADMQFRVKALNDKTDERTIKRIFGLDKPSFSNDGLVTVRTISGQWTYVNTTTQSFLNASSAPQLTSMLSALGTGSATAPGANSALSTVLTGNPLLRTEALASALSNYQTTYAQIGRGLAISAIPRSLSTASAAEIAVTLNADESASPSYLSGGTPSPTLNTSRVANHDTATRVRVDSVKLFEISSLTAIIQRSRGRFPLVPPFVEIPYIGTLAGIPMGSATEYHSSSAILSAYVVPTAADIAYGLRFVSDLVVDGLNPGPCSFFKGAAGPDVSNACLFRKAISMRDLNEEPLSEFNRQITRCFAMDTSAAGCGKVSFDGTPRYFLKP